MTLVLEKGHSRVPVYYEETTNIIGLILVISFPIFYASLNDGSSPTFQSIWNKFISNMYQLHDIFS